MKNRSYFPVLLLLAVLLLTGCSQTKQPSTVPQNLQGTVFVYDQLESGEGSGLFTLRFGESGYTLCRDGGVGILSSGDVREESDGSLIFSDEQGDFCGLYSGGSFREPSLRLSFPDGEMTLVPATETTEDVYQSFLGIYEGTVDGSPATLILERWEEFYLVLDGELTRGSYDVYSDRRMVFTPYGGKPFEAKLEFPAEKAFDQRELTIGLDGGTLTFGEPEQIYDAAHAMGTYTLSEYHQNVFTIRGVDGFLKAFGTLEDGTALYFLRKFTGEAEKSDRFRVSYEQTGEELRFPDSTPLLPRFGNLNEETGYGQYWSAGTHLEFFRRQADGDLSAGIQFVSETRPYGVSGGNFPESIRGLEPSMPSVGTAKPLVLLVDFPDYHWPRHVTAEGMEQALFSLDDPNSLASFYYRSSYGNLVIDGTVLDWYRTRQNRDSYTSDYEIMAEVLDHYIDEGLDLSQFDSDNDGAIDSLYILWAGNLSGQEGIWNVAYRSSWGTSPEEWSRKVTGYIFVPGSTVWSLVPPLKCNTNALIHESGHLLGLNDYYSYDTGARKGYTGGALEGGLAGMDMMDANIGDHNLFSKWLLGWAQPRVIEQEDLASLDGEVFRIRPSSLAPEGIFIKLKPSDSLYTELLVIEAVAPVGNASEYTRLKEPVVRVLHVDASVEEPGMEGNWRGYGFRNDNSYTTTKFIAALEADGADSFLNYLPAAGGIKPSYSAKDYFRAGDTIGPDTYPNTNAYDSLGNASVPTGLTVTVEAIEEDGTAVIRLGYQEPGDSVSLVSVMPQPQEVPYESIRKVPEGTAELVLSYDREIRSDRLDELFVCRDQQILEGVTASVDGTRLVITLPEPIAPESAVTLVIPHGILQDAANPKVVNNSNGIYGFAG